LGYDIISYQLIGSTDVENSYDLAGSNLESPANGKSRGNINGGDIMHRGNPDGFFGKARGKQMLPLPSPHFPRRG
jgi:hypothetical protein